MSNLFRMALAWGAVIGVLVAASAASAQVEVLREDGAHCASFTMVGHDPAGATCTVHAVGSFGLYLHNGAAEKFFASCNNELNAVFNEAGTAYIYNQIVSPEGGVCGREPCDEAASSHENLPWPAQLIEATPGQLQMQYTFCLYVHNADPASEGTAGTSCQTVINVATNSAHDTGWATLAGSGGSGGSPCMNLGGVVEIVGSWSTAPTEQHPNDIEIVH
jgi:hypothetical protein